MVQLLIEAMLAPVELGGHQTSVRYSSHELDPFRLAGEQHDGRSAQRRGNFCKAYDMLRQADELLGTARPVSAAAWVMKAHWQSEGLLELSHKFQEIILARTIALPGGLRQQPDTEKLLVTLLLSLKALSTTEWETAATLATWALEILELTPTLAINVVTPSQLKWSAHTIIGSVHQRLLQCPNSSLQAASAAHAAALKRHVTAAASLRPGTPRAPFELGWSAWSRGSYTLAAHQFRECLMAAAKADDDIFVCAASWALAATIAQGSWGFEVAVAQLQGLLKSAQAAEARLSQWGMGSAVAAIAAFARGPMQCVRLPERQLAVPAQPGLRYLRGRPAGPQVCTSCGVAFMSTMRCATCKKVSYCSRSCQQQHRETHLVTCTPLLT